ncbi:hypothetical protein C8R43DRAFT_1033438 [Mycena crocata]|nr:hypothetical protein C8R43DRAFT_1033438 [Mycena crocata]
MDNRSPRSLQSVSCLYSLYLLATTTLRCRPSGNSATTSPSHPPQPLHPHHKDKRNALPPPAEQRNRASHPSRAGSLLRSTTTSSTWIGTRRRETTRRWDTPSGAHRARTFIPTPARRAHIARTHTRAPTRDTPTGTPPLHRTHPHTTTACRCSSRARATPPPRPYHLAPFRPRAPSRGKGAARRKSASRAPSPRPLASRTRPTPTPHHRLRAPHRPHTSLMTSSSKMRRSSTPPHHLRRRTMRSGSQQRWH